MLEEDKCVGVGQFGTTHLNSSRTCICYSECSERSVRSARWYLPALESYTEVSKLPDTADLKPTSQVKGTAAS